MTLPPGCESVKSGMSNSVGYVRGRYTGMIANRVEKVCSAATAAIDSLKFQLDEKQCDVLTGKIIARNSLNKRISIKFNRIDTRMTRVEIQVGTLGDKDVSEALFEEIKKHI
jgi:hypothetical protein